MGSIIFHVKEYSNYDANYDVFYKGCGDAHKIISFYRERVCVKSEDLNPVCAKESLCACSLPFL